MFQNRLEKVTPKMIFSYAPIRTFTRRPNIFYWEASISKFRTGIIKYGSYWGISQQAILMGWGWEWGRGWGCDWAGLGWLGLVCAMLAGLDWAGQVGHRGEIRVSGLSLHYLPMTWSGHGFRHLRRSQWRWTWGPSLLVQPNKPDDLVGFVGFVP